MIINEFTRSELITKSKTPGFNRYKTRMTVKPKEIIIDRVIIGKLQYNSPHLDVYFKVRDYICSIRLINYMVRVRVLYEQSKYRNDIRKLLEIAFNYTVNKNDLLINCTCPDFYYRFSYSATVNNYGFNTNQLIPAKIRNPENQGSGCKHLTRIINAPSLWKGKVITAVLQAIKADPSLLGGDVQ
jgi:hypothetical protein